MDNGTNTEFEVKVTPTHNKAVDSQNLSMAIHLEETLLVEKVLMHKNMETLQYCFFPSTPVPSLHSWNTTENYVFLWTKGKSTVWVQMTTQSTVTRSALFLTQQTICHGSLSSASVIAHKLITVRRCRTNGHWKGLHSIFPSGTFAYKRLAQALRGLVSAFSIFMREYLDPVVKADHCSKNVDNIWIAANKAADHNRNIGAALKCIGRARLKKTLKKSILESHRLNSMAEHLHQALSYRKLGKLKTLLAQNSKLKIPKPKKAL